MKTTLIAEIAQAHEGSLGIAHSFIDALSKTGISTVKFQTHIADVESSEYETFRVNFSYEDKTRFDYWKRMEFTEEQWRGLKEHCDACNLEFLSSPFSNAAVDLLEKINVKRYKIGSGEISNFLLLEKVAKTGKPIIISSGMSDLNELMTVFQFLNARNIDMSILQCTTAYPTAPGQWNLNLIDVLKDKFNVPIGYSDHSGEVYPLIAAFVKGAQIIEFHVTFDKRMFGPDAKASLNIDEVKYLVDAIQKLEIDFEKKATKSINNDLYRLKEIFGKSLSINKDLMADHVLSFDDLDTKKPKGYGIDANKFEKVIGRKLKFDKLANSFIKESDLI